MAKFKVLQENVSHHVQEEEGEMFEKARRALEKSVLQQLAADYETARDRQRKLLGGVEL